ncbi:hypothetical protein HW115_14665 [Verrucomicrobiaceae bacterium N1E253]|uniref:AB hydrolase-1 domain-containing protein n=1 Tax=Oceaniferula marina TaxID=2748318 RepID=A0A851GH58_9BACT|nr:hypothetical protein [Oceaniferula marina]NWK56863.1 hypothetical protein [Oceaniferula marina]
MKHPALCLFRSVLTAAFALGLAAQLTSCSSPQQRQHTKITVIANSGSKQSQEHHLAEALATAESCLQRGIDTPEQLARYNQAVEHAVLLWLAGSEQDLHQQRLNVDSREGKPYQVQASWPAKLRFDRLIPSWTVKRGSLRKNIHRQGAGAPFVAQWEFTPKRSENEPFMSSKGYFASVTATLDFQASESERTIARLVIHNANITPDVRLGGNKHTLNFDQSALAEHLLAYDNEFSALGALLRPHKYLDQIDLQTISPPDPDRLPVIFTHGLASEPRTWQNVYNELRSDPVLRERCQIYFFRYPSGVPVLYSAAQLRTKLAELQQTLNQKQTNRYSKQMMLVGHSMGGLITKTQVQDSGDTMWLNFIDYTQNRVRLNDQQLAALQQYLIFKPNPHISRVLFIATPHRGSELADWWITRQFRKLIKGPGIILRTPLMALDQDNTDQHAQSAIDKLFHSGIPTSMENLSPKSKFVKDTINLPLKKDLRIHSIIGNLKGLDLNDPECSDGVVPYTSAHLQQPDSELVVPYGHSAHEHPMAIEEIRRLILLHLKELK